MALGLWHTIVLKQDTGVRTYGSNQYGQTSIPDSARAGVVAVAAGDEITAVLKSGGEVVTWGGSYPMTVPASAKSGVVAIAAARDSTLALKEDGSLLSWNVRELSTPTILAQGRVIRIAAGGHTMMALKADGGVVQWFPGSTSEGAVPAAALSGVIEISTGGDYSLALKSDGTVIGWGISGMATTVVPDFAQSGVIAISAGWIHALALKANGEVVAWGNGTHGKTTVPESAKSGVVAIAANGHRSAALKSDGLIIEWGTNEAPAPIALKPEVSKIVDSTYGTAVAIVTGEVLVWGTGDLARTEVPLEARSGVTDIALGDRFAVALKAGGVLAWGVNDLGQTSVPSDALAGVKAVAAGYYHAVALRNDGRVVAWGSNQKGQTTVPLDALNSVVAVVAKANHVIALRNDGRVIAWGSNEAGQTTVPPEAQSGVIAIAGSFSHTMALKTDGSVVAWKAGMAQTMVPASATSGVVSIGAGTLHSVALKSDGSVVAWGDRFYGQTNTPSPDEFSAEAIAADGEGSWYRVADAGTGVMVVENPLGTRLTNGSANHSFGKVVLGTTATVDITIRNIGNGRIRAVALSKTGANADEFVISKFPATVIDGYGELTTFTVNFTPTLIGDRTALIQIQSNVAEGIPFEIELSGMAEAMLMPAIVVEQPVRSRLVDGASKKSFGTVRVGRRGHSKTFVIRNKGASNLTSLKVGGSGVNPQDFRIVQPLARSLAPGAKTSFQVKFSPTIRGIRRAKLQIYSNDIQENPFDINLTGLGVSP